MTQASAPTTEHAAVASKRPRSRKRFWAVAAVLIAATAVFVALLFHAAPRSPYYGRPQAELRGLLALATDGSSSLELNAHVHITKFLAR